MLTEMQRLEVENCVLRRVIGQIRRASDKQEASGDMASDIAVLNLKERIGNEVDYGDRLERELAWAAYYVNFYPGMNWAQYLRGRFPDDITQKKNPGRSQEPGK